MPSIWNTSLQIFTNSLHRTVQSPFPVNLVEEPKVYSKSLRLKKFSINIPHMGIINKTIIILLLVVTADSAFSRPISWSGGSTIMYKTNSMHSSYYYHYSPSYKYSMGLEYINNRHFNDQYINLKTTYLLGRKNTKKSQANLYLTGGISTKSKDNHFYGVHNF